MSMPSLALRVSFLIQIWSPLEACSAKAASPVAPYTVPSTTLRPFGPTLGELYLWVQRTLPLARSTAWMLESMSCEYITPFSTTGVLEYPPNAPLAVIGSVHATPSVETLARSIGPPTLRVFCRSAFGRFHAEVPVVLLLELLLPPQATTKTLVTMSSPTLAAHLPRRLARGGWAFFIVFP